MVVVLMRSGSGDDGWPFCEALFVVVMVMMMMKFIHVMLVVMIGLVVSLVVAKTTSCRSHPSSSIFVCEFFDDGGTGGIAVIRSVRNT